MKKLATPPVGANPRETMQLMDALSGAVEYGGSLSRDFDDTYIMNTTKANGIKFPKTGMFGKVSNKESETKYKELVRRASASYNFVYF